MPGSWHCPCGGQSRGSELDWWADREVRRDRRTVHEEESTWTKQQEAAEAVAVELLAVAEGAHTYRTLPSWPGPVEAACRNGR